MGKKCLDFGDLDLIFKITPTFWIWNFDQKILAAPYLLTQIMYSGQTLYIVSVGWL